MPHREKTLLRAAVCLLLFALASASALSSARALRSAGAAALPGQDGPSIWEGRMARPLNDLPPDAVVGYLSERDVPGAAFDPIDQDEEFAMTQFFLAPRILVEGAGGRWVIGNFSDQTVPIANVIRHFNLKLLVDYGMGIYLFELAVP